MSATPIRLPEALTTPDDERALTLLGEYYGRPYGAPGGLAGAAFDTWDSTGTRVDDANRFTSDDLVAVTFLSLNVPASTARVLLRDRVDDFAGLLATSARTATWPTRRSRCIPAGPPGGCSQR
nr:DUF6308 family protein [Plantactinospora alkalitolerans]